MLDTSALTVTPGSGSALGAAGGGGAGEITFSGTDREATGTLRTRRPLRASARTTVVTRLGGVSSEAPWSPIVTNVISPSLKQKFITLFSSAQTPISYYMAPGPFSGRPPGFVGDCRGEYQFTQVSRSDPCFRKY